MERLRELYDPDATATPPPGWPEPGPFAGRDAILREFDHIREAFGAADALAARSDFLAVNDRVVVRIAWVGAGQGPAMDMEFTVSGQCGESAYSVLSISGITKRPSKPPGCRSSRFGREAADCPKLLT